MSSKLDNNPNDEKLALPPQDKELGETPPPPTSAEPVNTAPEVSDDDDDLSHDDGRPKTLPFSKGRCIALVATLTGASFMNTLSLQAVVIILPTIGRALDIPDSRQQWIVSAYSLTFGCFLLLWGRIADIYGKRKIFVLGSAWVTATTLVNPFVPNEIGFDIFRALQGLGAAANVPTAIGILGTTFPPGKAKNYSFSAYAAGAPLGSIFGNLLGGLIASYANWKWVFGAMALLALIITVASVFVIPPPPTTLRAQGVRVKATVDWIGAVIITTGLVALLFALTEGNVVGWSTPWIPVLIVVSIILIAIFVFWQRYLEKTGKATPLMKVSIFKSKRFSAGMFIMALFFASFNGYLVYATYYFQDYQGLSAIQTTLRFIPTGIMGVTTAAVVSRLIAVIPTYMLLLFGNFCVSVSCLLFAVPIPATTSYFAYGLPAMILCVLGADTTWPSLTLFTSHSLPHEDQAMGGALVNAVGQFGRAIGLAIGTAIQTAVMAHERGTDVQHVGSLQVHEDATWLGLRAAQWLNFALGMTSFTVVALAFRGSGIIGKAGVQERGRTGGEEGIMDEEND